MINSSKKYTFDRVVRMILSTITLVAILWLMRYLSEVLIPFAIALVLAYLINPVVELFVSKTNKRGLSVGITLTGIAILGISLGAITVALVASQTEQFGNAVDRLQNEIATAISEEKPVTQIPVIQNKNESEDQSDIDEESEVPEKSTWGFRELSTAWDEFQEAEPGNRLNDFMGKIDGTYAGQIFKQALSSLQKDDKAITNIIDTTRSGMIEGGTILGNIFLDMIFLITGLIIIIIYLVFLLLDYPYFRDNWKQLLPPQYRTTIVEFLNEFDIAMRKYFRGQFIIASLTGILFAIGFSIIGLPMAVPLGIFLGILNMIPYLQFVGVVPAILLSVVGSLETGNSLGYSLILLAVVFIIVQLLQDALITPRIMGKATGLSPVMVMLGLFVWGKILGFLGLIIAIPLTCLGIAYYQRFVLEPGNDPMTDPIKKGNKEKDEELEDNRES